MGQGRLGGYSTRAKRTRDTHQTKRPLNPSHTGMIESVARPVNRASGLKPLDAWHAIEVLLIAQNVLDTLTFYMGEAEGISEIKSGR